jgi:hypothetical protein
VAISGERKGRFRIADFRYPTSGHNDAVTLTLIPDGAQSPSSVASDESSSSAPSGSAEQI